MNFGQRIKFIRNDSKLTQSQFADIFNKTHTAVQFWEANKSKPPKRDIDKMCKLFKVNKEWLITGKGEIYSQDLNANNNVSIGSNNRMEAGGSNTININGAGQEPEMRKDVAELIQLLNDYAPPTMVKQIKDRLLEIKKNYNL
ncbi:helix-turn-helix domain-containing protein [Limisalsivibrio acetivorans]|uniref:helix-turn-helix domain-containing protein n=1 Tax=Limisalsivibrio acetivorans TaxID=1304888 RepID=UPI0003B3116D|nr:helix-turn-helix transcriptional regulator [Limisalsivibrio acetivorans]